VEFWTGWFDSEETWTTTYGTTTRRSTREGLFILRFCTALSPCLWFICTIFALILLRRVLFYHPRVFFSTSLESEAFVLRPTCLSGSALLEFPPIFPRFSRFSSPVWHLLCFMVLWLAGSRPCCVRVESLFLVGFRFGWFGLVLPPFFPAWITSTVALVWFSLCMEWGLGPGGY